MINTSSETWRYIKKHLEVGIEDNRRQLESALCPVDAANILRGRIMAANDLLELPNADLE